MTSATDLIEYAATALTSRRWEEARRYIARAYAIDGENPVTIYTEALYHYRAGDPQEALTLLNHLTKRKITDPHIDLLRADLYQYELHQPHRALEAVLRVAKALETDEIASRIEALTEEVSP